MLRYFVRNTLDLRSIRTIVRSYPVFFFRLCEDLRSTPRLHSDPRGSASPASVHEPGAKKTMEGALGPHEKIC